MFGLLNTTQIYGIQQHHQVHVPQQQQQTQFHIINNNLVTPTTNATTNSSNHRRAHSSVSDTGNRFFASLTSKNPTNFIEKFLKTDLLSTYDTIKNYRNYPANTQNSLHNNTTTNTTNKRHSDPLHYESGSKLTAFNCLQGSYRHSFDGEFYVPVKVKNNNSNSSKDSTPNDLSAQPAEMTIKCSKNLLAVDAVEQGPATLQNYQKIPESEHDLLVDSLVASSGASSGEFNSSSDGAATTTGGNASSSSSSGHSGSSSLSSSNLYKRLSFGGRNSQNNTKSEKNANADTNAQALAQQRQRDGVTLNLSSSSIMPTLKTIDLQRSSSSTSSSGDFLSKRERKKGAMTPQPEKTPLANLLSPSSTTSSVNNQSNANSPLTPEKAQRRKLLQMLSSYDQQNKFLQRELAKEKRRRTEELACVVKSLLCFEAKLKNDMKAVNQRLQEKDGEICRLVRQNRALRKQLAQLQKEARESAQDEGVVEDDDEDGDKETKDLLEDCLVLEALQCINCRKQFYDIEVQDNCTQTIVGGSTSIKEANSSRSNDEPTTEHGSSSDDTVSSSFFGARRSVRYTSKRTSGTFRDYMRSRAMNIDDPALEATTDITSPEEYTNNVSRDNSQTSYEKLHIYSRTMERMHGVKSESERDSEHSGLDTSSSITRSNSRASTKSSKSTISTATSKASEVSSQNLEEDDGIFSPTQDEDFEEEVMTSLKQEDGVKILKIVRGRALEAFSEASPKQIYETSTDDWYASASDQEEISGAVTAKSYGQGAVNPVLECVNQILLQQSMEGVEERSQTPKNSTTLPRRSSLSDRRNNQRSNSRASDGGATPGSRNGTLTRKRVHFSTKNSMVHVPRNDETEEDEEDDDLKNSTMISNYQGMSPSSAYMTHSPALEVNAPSPAAERLETFNYESIYSNEYEPIGSELNSSNLYVDMDATTGNSNSKPLNLNSEHLSKTNKLPPALPPKPANLLKFKKSLQQLDESPDELLEAHNSEVLVEPDYCSISEVNVGITSVQIRADIHRIPLSERDLESVMEQDNDLDAATVISEAASSQKTEEIEEIFADIPKLPNVAAIIAPKSALKQNDYLIMSPKTDTKLGIMAFKPSSSNTSLSNITTTTNKPDRNNLKLNLTPISSILTNSLKNSNKVETTNALRPQLSSANYQQQYKRKHMPNILQEINKRLSLPNSPITPTTPKTTGSTSTSLYGKSNDVEALTSLPLQAEFDWYNLDAEYGKNSHQAELTKVNESLNTTGIPTLLADIKEDGESLITTADEYNLDEEYKNELEREEQTQSTKHFTATEATLCEAINPSSNLTKARKIKKNLANFEKFIETTSLTSKPLPTKRKIYFAGPFV